MYTSNEKEAFTVPKVVGRNTFKYFSCSSSRYVTWSCHLSEPIDDSRCAFDIEHCQENCGKKHISSSIALFLGTSGIKTLAEQNGGKNHFIPSVCFHHHRYRHFSQPIGQLHRSRLDRCALLPRAVAFAVLSIDEEESSNLTHNTLVRFWGIVP